jgi:hypothetical protein
MKTMKKFAAFFLALFLLLGLVQLAGAQLLLPEEVQVINLVNQERAERGIAPVWQNTPLSAAADRHSTDMDTNDFFSHTGSDGSTFVTRDQQAGYTGSPVGECIGWGYPTAEAMVDGWMNSSGHYAILMSTSADRIGISHVETYWTLEMGRSGTIDAAGITVQLTNNTGVYDVFPQEQGNGSVVWQSWDGHDYEIYRQSLGQSVVQVTNNDSADAKPQVNASGHTVWQNWDGSDWEVWCNLGNGAVQITNNTGYDVLPQITANDKIYWQNYDGNDYEICRYDPATQATTQLTNNSVADVWIQVNQSGQLTWMEWDGGNWQVWYDPGSGPVKLTASGSNQKPAISDDGQIVWQKWDGSDYEMCRFDTVKSVTTQLTTNTVDDVTPSVQNGVMVWSHWDGSYWQIYREILSTGAITQITSGGSDNKNPRVNVAGQIVWQKWDGSDYEIYVYK